MHGSNTVMNLPSAPELMRRVIITVVTGGLLIYSNVCQTMFTSTKTFKPALYPAFFLYVVFCSMWVYTASYLQRKDVRWFQTHETFLYTATAVVSLASILWIIGMWGEYGVLTIPLYAVIAAFVAHLVGLIPSTGVKPHNK